jgi:hypothetical protein
MVWNGLSLNVSFYVQLVRQNVSENNDVLFRQGMCAGLIKTVDVLVAMCMRAVVRG